MRLVFLYVAPSLLYFRSAFAGDNQITRRRAGVGIVGQCFEGDGIEDVDGCVVFLEEPAHFHERWQGAGMRSFIRDAKFALLTTDVQNAAALQRIVISLDQFGLSQRDHLV